MPFQVCPMHSSDEIVGRPVPEPPGSLEYVCSRPGHVDGRPYAWLEVPEPPDSGLSEVATRFQLDVELPAAVAQFGAAWVEYGAVEAEYARRRPDDFAELVRLYGHTAVAAKRYTASAFLARTLGSLAGQGLVSYHSGPATGRWDYNTEISWWAVPPAPEWGTAQISWKSLGWSMDYVPGKAE